MNVRCRVECLFLLGLLHKYFENKASSPLAVVIFLFWNKRFQIFMFIVSPLLQTFGAKTLGYFKFIMSLFVAGCTFGSLNSNIFAASRLFFVGAQNGHLPQAISLIHVNKFTPIPSLLSMVILCLSCTITLQFFNEFRRLNP